MTEEEAKAFSSDGDPIEAPHRLYKIQPDYLGKFLWITGPPGLGKCTSAQLLSNTAGYVYYEADCYGSCRNPYIPVDVQNPSLAQVNQRPLRGEGLAERKEMCMRSNETFMKLFKGEEYDNEIMKEFYSGMSKDILSERKRIGGDWAIAAVTLTRDLRDHIRYP
jgi:DNA polymerase III delta prime subunit